MTLLMPVTDIYGGETARKYYSIKKWKKTEKYLKKLLTFQKCYVIIRMFDAGVAESADAHV